MKTAEKKSKPVAKRSAKPSADDAFADKMLRQFDRQKAVLSKDQVYAIERCFEASSGNSQYRRTGLAFLMKSGKELVQLAKTDRATGEMLADFAEGVERSAARHRAIAEALESSALRITTALCTREDALDLLKAAKAEHAQHEKASRSEAAND